MSLQLNQANNVILHITSDGRLVPGSGLAEDEVTKRVFALMVAQFEDAWARRERERKWRSAEEVLKERKEGWYWVKTPAFDEEPTILYLADDPAKTVEYEQGLEWVHLENSIHVFAGPLSDPDSP